MKLRQLSNVVIGSALLAIAGSAAAADIKGAAILDHPCGKVAVKHMGLVHDGKMDEANKLGSPEMQKQWMAMPAKDRTMMSGMMKDMSVTGQQMAADIKANGVLAVNGPAATLTIKKTQQDKNGSSSTTTTQNYQIAGANCMIVR